MFYFLFRAKLTATIMNIQNEKPSSIDFLLITMAISQTHTEQSQKTNMSIARFPKLVYLCIQMPYLVNKYVLFTLILTLENAKQSPDLQQKNSNRKI